MSREQHFITLMRNKRVVITVIYITKAKARKNNKVFGGMMLQTIKGKGYAS